MSGQQGLGYKSRAKIVSTHICIMLIHRINGISMGVALNTRINRPFVRICKNTLHDFNWPLGVVYTQWRIDRGEANCPPRDIQQWLHGTGVGVSELFLLCDSLSLKFGAAAPPDSVQGWKRQVKFKGNK